MGQKKKKKERNNSNKNVKTFQRNDYCKDLIYLYA